MSDPKVYGLLVFPDNSTYVSHTAFKTDTEAGQWLKRMRQIYPQTIDICDYMDANCEKEA